MRVKKITDDIEFEAILTDDALIVDGVPHAPDDALGFQVTESSFQEFRALGAAGFMMGASEDLARKFGASL